MNIYKTSEKDREKLKKPRGDIYKGKEILDKLKQSNYSEIIAVGDRVSHDIAKSEIEADLYITDDKTQREKFKQNFKINPERTFKAENPAGKITEEAWKAVIKASALKCKTHVHINGEEDLLGIPAVIFASKNAAVVYGLRDKGAVLMEATESNKEFSKNILDLERSEHLIVGGSWDLFHSGHRYILLNAVANGTKIDIGITSDKMLEKKLGNNTGQPFEKRKNQIKDFLTKIKTRETIRFIKINDIYGNAVEEGEKILVTKETEKNVQKINKKRKKKGKNPLPKKVISQLKDDKGKKISSTRIRNNEINENGL